MATQGPPRRFYGPLRRGPGTADPNEVGALGQEIAALSAYLALQLEQETFNVALASLGGRQ